MSVQSTTTISTIDQLLEHYDPPTERAAKKVVHQFDSHCRRVIAASPFMLLGTYSETNGSDCSPRGDQPGWVEVEDDRTLLIPDRRGNNRIDSLRNIVEQPRVGLLFMIPGMNETLRVNGRAVLSIEPELLQRFAVQGKAPMCVIVVTLEEAFIQCARALVRSDLWNPAKHVDRATLPSMGQIMETHTCGIVEGAVYDAEAPTLIPKTLY